MTKQELFDKVVTHLLTQREKSVSPNGDCMYRGPDGLKCAIGCIIPEGGYRLDFEGLSIRKSPELQTVCGLDDIGTVSLARSLQLIHDDVSPRFWRESLSNLGIAYKLDVSVCHKHSPIGDE